MSGQTSQPIVVSKWTAQLGIAVIATLLVGCLLVLIVA